RARTSGRSHPASPSQLPSPSPIPQPTPSPLSPYTTLFRSDWLHLVAGSLWIGGLIGLLVVWRSLPALRRLAGLVICVPRFSNVRTEEHTSELQSPYEHLWRLLLGKKNEWRGGDEGATDPRG